MRHRLPIRAYAVSIVHQHRATGRVVHAAVPVVVSNGEIDKDDVTDLAVGRHARSWNAGVNGPLSEWNRVGVVTAWVTLDVGDV